MRIKKLSDDNWEVVMKQSTLNALLKEYGHLPEVLDWDTIWEFSWGVRAAFYYQTVTLADPSKCPTVPQLVHILRKEHIQAIDRFFQSVAFRAEGAPSGTPPALWERLFKSAFKEVTIKEAMRLWDAKRRSWFSAYPVFLAHVFPKDMIPILLASVGSGGDERWISILQTRLKENE